MRFREGTTTTILPIQPLLRPSCAALSEAVVLPAAGTTAIRKSLWPPAVGSQSNRQVSRNLFCQSRRMIFSGHGFRCLAAYGYIILFPFLILQIGHKARPLITSVCPPLLCGCP